MVFFSTHNLLRNKFIWFCILALFIVNIYVVVVQLNHLHTMIGHVIKKNTHSIGGNAREQWDFSRVKLGVDPNSPLHSLSNSTRQFTCFDGSVTMAIENVNDNYCDCPSDGSDEPGTNACNNGRFFCALDGKFVPSFYVNDGICDCCDGADEWMKRAPIGFPLPEHPTKYFSPCSDHCERYKIMKKTWLDNIRYEHLVAGLSGGVASTLILHPFDLIKIRFQVDDGKSVIQYRQKYNGIADAFKSIVRTSGFKGLYQGVSPNVAGAGSSWGLYFFAFNFCKQSFKDFQKIDDLSASTHLVAGAVAGVFTLSLTNPIWVVKTRMCLQSDAAISQVYYNGVLDGLKKLYKQEGVKGYYRGFIPGLFGVSHGALQFMAYEELKKIMSNYTGQPSNTKLNPFQYIVMAALSKVFAVVTTYPYQVVRSRLQDVQLQHHYNGVVDVFQKVLRNEGVPGFYKGMVPSLLRVTPACCITFLVYENISHYLLNKNEK